MSYQKYPRNRKDPSNKEFTDEEFLKYYNLGYSDRKIAKKLKVDKSSILTRRWKLGLEANYFNFKGEKFDKIKIKIAYKKYLKDTKKSRKVITYNQYMKKYMNEVRRIERSKI